MKLLKNFIFENAIRCILCKFIWFLLICFSFVKHFCFLFLGLLHQSLPWIFTKIIYQEKYLLLVKLRKMMQKKL